MLVEQFGPVSHFNDRPLEKSPFSFLIFVGFF